MAITSGRESSEYVETRQTRARGWILVGLGVVVALAASLLGRPMVALAGVCVGALGAHIVASSVASYARSRGMVKASAAAPPAQKRF